MLEKLLQIVAEGGIHSCEDLAGHLSIPQPLLETMVEELARLGYLREVGDGCGGHCVGCSIGGCSVVGPGRLWTLTGKGSRAAARSAHQALTPPRSTHIGAFLVRLAGQARRP